jgi:hypothetical protein
MSDTEKLLRDFYTKAAAAGVAAIAEAVEKERERCARVCEEMANSRYQLKESIKILTSAADAIRKGE